MATAFLEVEWPNAQSENSDFHVIPVPYEASVSYGGGTKNGPDAIIEASNQLEIFDLFFNPTTKPLKIHTKEAVDCNGRPGEVLERIRHTVSDTLKQKAVPVVLGGEHTVTYGAALALSEKGEKFGIVQFDAHADMRYAYDETSLCDVTSEDNVPEDSKFSHACVMRRCHELGIPVFGIALRAFSKEEHLYMKEQGIKNLTAFDIAQSKGKYLDREILPLDFPKNIYISFDVDGLDPSVIRATGTPVPGGLFWQEAMDILKNIQQGRQIIGIDVTELAPCDNDNASNFAAALLTYRLMCMV